MSLTPPSKVRKLQETLHAKAKGAPDYRFYALYDKLHREDILDYAYRICRQNDGSPGVDGQTFEDIDKYGEERWLSELTQELKEQSYRPSPVRRVWIPKPDGSKRPLGIGTIRDRVAQMAVVLVLSPIFEADLQPEQYGYRPDRSALDAVDEVHRLLKLGYTDVVDADLSGYFDTIPHSELMKSLARRISDGRLLALIKMWLVTAVEEIDERGGRHRTTRNKDEGRGTPQGSPLSPLLSNVYMRRFVLGWKTQGHNANLKAEIVNYADDFVICCRGTAEAAMAQMRSMMEKLKLTVNERKTRKCRVPEESFDFLGYTLGRCWSARTGRSYISPRPSAKKIAALKRKMSEETSKAKGWMPVESRVVKLNQMMLGWSNYFCRGPVSSAYRAIERHARERLRHWLRRKHKLKSRGTTQFPDGVLHEELGLIRLSKRTRIIPNAKA